MQSATTTRTESSRPRWVVLGLAALLFGAAFMGVRWWTHPSAFGGLGDSVEMSPRPVAEAALSTTVIYPKVEGDPETVTLEDARAVFSENSARSTATFWVCHMGPKEDPIGSVNDPENSCRDMEPLRAGMKFRHGLPTDSDYLFVTVTPTRVGTSHLTHVEVSYKRGSAHLFQRGTETIRVNRTLTARR